MNELPVKQMIKQLSLSQKCPPSPPLFPHLIHSPPAWGKGNSIDLSWTSRLISSETKRQGSGTAGHWASNRAQSNCLSSPAPQWGWGWGMLAAPGFQPKYWNPLYQHNRACSSQRNRVSQNLKPKAQRKVEERTSRSHDTWK